MNIQNKAPHEAPRRIQVGTLASKPAERGLGEKHEPRNLARAEAGLAAVAERARALEIPRREARDAHARLRLPGADHADERGFLKQRKIRSTFRGAKVFASRKPI